MVYFIPEVFEKELGRNKFVRAFFPASVLVITFA
jgi:hypothetical protein